LASGAVGIAALGEDVVAVIAARARTADLSGDAF
jgi:hypothetical protein